jgi:hypothetical protein
MALQMTLEGCQGWKEALQIVRGTGKSPLIPNLSGGQLLLMCRSVVIEDARVGRGGGVCVCVCVCVCARARAGEFSVALTMSRAGSGEWELIAPC